MNELPTGWITVSLCDIGTLKYGKGLPTSKLLPTGFPVFGANGIIGHFNEFMYEDEQILISCRGANSGTINVSPRQCFVTNNSLVFELPECLRLARPFLTYALKHADKSRIVSGSAQPQVTIANAENFVVAFAPLPEQRRIVAKIDSLSGKSRRALDQLDHIPRLVEKYKQAILAAAFGGKLTTEKTERKALGNICQIRSGFAFKSSDFRSVGDVPVVRIGDITDGAVIFSDSSKFVDESFLSTASDFRVERGDILVALSGATTGKSGVYKLEQPALLNQRVARLKVAEPLSPDAHLIAYFVRWISDEILKASYGGAQPSISPHKLAAFELEWPATKNGCSEIVGKLQTAFAWIDRLSSEATSARKLIDHLDQAVLAKAFRGELVPQDPDDEPASVLLERIRTERASGSRKKVRLT